MSIFRADVTIVGSGIAGLWSAKELIDRGLTVNIVEKSDTIADGATTKNEGWLHAGTYHSVAIEKEDEVESVVTNTRLSHEAIVKFAPESIDHTPTYAVTLSDDLAHRATQRWQKTGVGYQEVSKHTLLDAGTIDLDRLSTVFRVDDKSVNTRILCQKLAEYVYEHGGKFFMSAEFLPTSDTTANIVQNGETHTLQSDNFLVTAGAGVKDVVETISGRELPMRFFKAHLLVMPRLTIDNYFHLEVGEVGVMSHGDTSILGINRDGIELPVSDQEVVQEKKELIYNAMMRFQPSMVKYALYSTSVVAVACSKPDVTGGFGQTQSLDVNIFKPSSNYLCALPGKMTMAPHLAKEVADILLSSPRRSVKQRTIGMPPGEVTLRPADRWLTSDHIK